MSLIPERDLSGSDLLAIYLNDHLAARGYELETMRLSAAEGLRR